MIQRWDDLTPEEQQRYTDNERLRALLAERTTALEQLQMALHVKHAQLATVTAERDAAVTRAEAAETRLLALQVDRSKTVKLRDETDSVIWSLKPEDVPGAINWGDLGVCEVQEVITDERRWYRVVIEEADPSNPALHVAVLAGLAALGWDTDDIELETAW